MIEGIETGYEGKYDFPTRAGDFNLSVLQSFDSGTRTSVTGTIDPSPYVTNPGYISQVTSATYFFGPRGNLKTQDVYRTDLSINYKLRLVSGVQFFIQPEILNIFNRQAIVSFDQEVLTAADTTSLKPFNPFKDTPAQGVNYALGPNFGQPSTEGDYQTPRTFRMSLGLRF